MPLVINGDIASWDELARGFRSMSFWEKRNIGMHLNTEVTEIDRRDKYLVADGKKYGYDKLILALGSTPVIPSFPGLDGKNEYAMSTDVADGMALTSIMPQYTEVAIIGGGFISLEIAAALKARGYSKVYLLVRRAILRANLDQDMAEKVGSILADNGVEVIMPAGVESVASAGGRKQVILSDRELSVDFIFFGTGAVPNAGLARKAELDVGETGAIVVNKYLQTSDPDIYAIGDCMENWDMVTGSKRRHQLASNAIRTGFIAGRNVAQGNLLTYEGTVMPFVTKIFGHQIGAVGFTEREAGEKGLNAVSVTIDTPRLRDRFNGKPARYKLVADGKTGNLLGAQVISEEIVTGTIDKLAVAIACKMPLAKLVQIDSSYSPHVQEDQIAVPLHRLLDKLG
jgi:NADPH-dependent 2,4-dienoyl-CoA reductase/sulfur reductase-like enzyme